MGNSPSNSKHNAASPPQPTPVIRSRPLKSTTKKRSIVDHPLLPHPTPPTTPRTQPIPIPSQSVPTSTPRPRPPQDSTVELLHREASTHRPIQYNSTRSFGAVRSGAAAFVSQEPGPGRDAPPPPFVPEVVRSSIPLRLAPGESDDEASGEEQDSDGRTPVVVTWQGGGKDVFLAGTFDELEWRARQRMRFDPKTQTHSHTLHLPPGTYRLKFIVDDTWRCSPTLPTATDDETGNLVNYVDVLAPSPPALAPAEVQGREARVMKANRRRTHPVPSSHTTAHRWHPPQLPPAFFDEPDTDTELESVAGWSRGRDGVLEKWTSVIPGPLMSAARGEEAYVAALQAQREARRGGAGVRGNLGLSAAAPAIPPAPRLPRHLDKVLLNVRTPKPSSRSRVGAGSSLLGVPGATVGARAGSEIGGGGGPGGGSAVGIGSTVGSGLLDGAWAQADDSSVLPVPSHVVLHHLGTSAIRNGVLAVSDTTRYNSKYITTIYYKPA